MCHSYRFSDMAVGGIDSSFDFLPFGIVVVGRSFTDYLVGLDGGDSGCCLLCVHCCRVKSSSEGCECRSSGCSASDHLGAQEVLG